eukprot:CAMPEP_0171500476 /NCGR_PEP_ID=MMETSP0958-20121227/9008_1 /TAXON_ID=87120 /ORGANISM="Aurantiochytrium limacinum, Strain ATCCMYA-1381" /LENGTH=95 /DNA_ID=CAMNT_0012035153 /DNA_START=94 /DNA_END=381 /DNA_ORIENTATION=+
MSSKDQENHERLLEAQKRSANGVRLIHSDEGAKKDVTIPSCQDAHKSSLRCIEKNYEQQHTCKPLFDAYKDCKKSQTEARILKNNQGQKASFFPW